MTHPLTDEICEELSGEPLSELAEHRAEWIRQDMRAAYDLAIEHIDELWTKAQQMEEPHEIVNDFENSLRLLSINKFLQSQRNNS